MSKRGDWLSFNSFSGGEQSDLPPHLIADDAFRKGINVVMDKIGRLAKRGPVQPYLKNVASSSVERVGLSKAVVGGAIPSSGFAVTKTGWNSFTLPSPPTNNRAGTLSPDYSFSSVAKTISVGGDPAWGPSFSSFGLTVFPLTGSGTDPFAAFANSVDVSSYNSFSNTNATIAVDVSASSININSPSETVNAIGSFIFVQDNNSVPTKEYVGIITGVDALNSYTVYPPPKVGFTVASGGVVRVSPYWSIDGKLVESGGSAFPSGATFGCVHQNRMVLLASATSTYSGSIFSNPLPTQKNVLVWSSITGEPATAANTNADGLLPLLYAGWPQSQQITIDTAEIVAVVSLDANNLLVLCAEKTLLISGVLGTIVPAGGINGSSFNIRTISTDVGCLDADSVQKTPAGVMFAFRDGVYVTDGASFKNVMADKIQQKWTVYNKSKNVDGNSVCGSAVIGGTHYAIFTERGPHFLCDLYNDFSWTEIVVGETTVNPNTSITLVNTTQNNPLSYVDPTAPMPDGSLPIASHNGDRVIINHFYNNAGVQTINSIRVFRNDGSRSAPSYVFERSIGPALSGLNSNPGFQDFDMDYIGERIVATSNPARNVDPSARPYLSTFVRTGTSWTSEANVLDPDANPTTALWGEACGFAKTSSDCVVVGAPGIDKCYVFRRNSSAWSYHSTIDGSAVGSSSSFGQAVALSGDGSTAIIASSGMLSIFSWNGLGYVFEQNYLVPGATYCEISSDGNVVCVGGSSTVSYAIRTDGAWPSVTTDISPFNGVNNISVTSEKLIVNDLDSGGSKREARIYSRVNDAFVFATNAVPLSTSYDGGVALTGDNRSFVFSMRTTTSTTNFYVYNFNNDPISYGVGVQDGSGSNEVYAPLVGDRVGDPAGDAIVLLDSMLIVDEEIETTALGFDQLYDAGTDYPFNATVETKSFALGDAATLKAYKTATFTYSADSTVNVDAPFSIYAAEGLDPQFDFSIAQQFGSYPSTASIKDSESRRVSLVPRPIDNGLALGFKTDFTAGDKGSTLGRFVLYDIALNAVSLRRGRTIQ